ncbi:hypothetical protein NP233_g7262 [Leucocoprinus birnbaumii]|uniref:DUF6534 domain-containing protein n=1 Tax=Leucocoprinus birnbaumii TaxID=56174 RepID=A0AAD5VSV0_9AGAR|nr:hypothetical protein NP233_g7262 [Leucocoprinus birnbaumii]
MDSPSRPQLPENAWLVLGPPVSGLLRNCRGMRAQQVEPADRRCNPQLVAIRDLSDAILQEVVYLNKVGNRDGKFLRGIVHFLFILDSAQTFMTMADIFFWFVRNYGDYQKMFVFNLAAVDGPLLDAIIAVTVQLVYCWRMWKIGRWKVLPLLSVACAVAACVGGMIAGIHSTIDPTNHDRPAVYLWLFGSAVTDIVIACSMAYMLMQFKTTETSRNTMAIIKRILLLTFETNAVTAAVAVALVTVFLTPSITPPNTNVYMVLYSNCFMVLLNQRHYYGEPGKTHGESSTLSSSSNRGRGTSSYNREASGSSQHHNRGQVSVIRFTEVRTEGSPDIEMGPIHEGRESHDLKSASPSTTLDSNQMDTRSDEAAGELDSLKKGFTAITVAGAFVAAIQGQVMSSIGEIPLSKAENRILQAVNSLYIIGLVLDVLSAMLAFLSTRWLELLSKDERAFLEQEFLVKWHRRALVPGVDTETHDHDLDAEKGQKSPRAPDVPQTLAFHQQVFYQWVAFSLCLPMPLLCFGIVCMLAGILTFVWSNQPVVVAVLVSVSIVVTIPFILGAFMVGRDNPGRKRVIVELVKRQGNW